MAGKTYSVFGYKGKQVRDNIHSYDVVRAAEEFFRNPRPGEVYNIGGGRDNSISILEAFDRVEQLIGKKSVGNIGRKLARGTICYIGDLRKLRAHLPEWKPTFTLDQILEGWPGPKKNNSESHTGPDAPCSHFSQRLNHSTDISASSNAMQSKTGSESIPTSKSFCLVTRMARLKPLTNSVFATFRTYPKTSLNKALARAF